MGKKGERVVNRFTKNGLDLTQKNVAYELAHKPFTQKSMLEIAKENNVNKGTIYRWKTFPIFNDEVNRISNEIQRSQLVDVNSMLMKMVNSDNEKSVLKAIELFYKKQGMLKDVQETTVSQTTKINIDDMLIDLETL